MTQQAENNRRGRFIVLEGPDGAGKTTQVELLKARLEEQGVRTLALREPGGTAAGEVIRSLLLDRNQKHLTPVSETFLFMAARSQLVTEAIRPALDEGTWVLSDRFTLSTLIYQGCAGRVDTQAIVTMSELATGHLTPDLYVVLWISAQESLRRRKGQPDDRMEAKGLGFLQEVSDSYKRIVSVAKGEYELIRAEGSVEEVREEIWQHVKPLFPSPGTG